MARIVTAWRRAGLPLLHVHHESVSATGCFRAGTPGISPKPETAPLAGERVYRKRVNSAFIGTTLESDLRNAGMDTLVIIGLTTNHCVSTTARMAGNSGFRTYVVSDATASFARAALDGTIRPAQQVHDAALSDLKDEFAEIVDTENVLSAAERAMRRATEQSSAMSESAD